MGDDNKEISDESFFTGLNSEYLRTLSKEDREKEYQKFLIRNREERKRIDRIANNLYLLLIPLVGSMSYYGFKAELELHDWIYWAFCLVIFSLVTILLIDSYREGTVVRKYFDTPRQEFGVSGQLYGLDVPRMPNETKFIWGNSARRSILVFLLFFIAFVTIWCLISISLI